MHASIDNGGLNAPDIFSIVKASRLIWIKRYTSSCNHIWKTLFENALKLSNLNPEILFFCDFDIKQWKNKHVISTFYQDVLTEWFRFGNANMNKDQIVWYNKNILIQEQPIFYNQFFKKGITYIRDLYDEREHLRNFEYWKSKGLKGKDFLKWSGIIASVTKNVPKKAIKYIVTNNLEYENLTYLNRPLKTVTAKVLYNHLLLLKCGDTLNIPRIAKYTNLNNTDWATSYWTALTIPIDTKTKDFQYRFLHDILVNNYWLKKWHLTENDMCTFCKKESETIIHLFWQCEYSQTFWQDFISAYKEIITEPFDVTLVICSSQNPLVCTLILLAKRYIQECRYSDIKPDIRVFKLKLNHVKNIEWEISKKK